MIDEDNIEDISDEFILQSLNRAQDDGMNILARHYEEPMLTYESLDLQSGVAEYYIPETAFEDRLEKVEIGVGETYSEVQRISYRDVTPYETQSNTDVPYYYAVVGRKIKLIPTPSGSYDARIWYLRAPDKLVKSQGRITKLGLASNYVVVDEAGSALSTEVDQLGSFVNVVDGQTGEVKGTLQIKTITDSRITFKSSPTRSTVYNRSIESDASDLASGLSIELDDYICSAEGTCVPQFARPMGNFLLQYADAEARMKLGGPADMSLRILEKFEKERVERTWVGRESTLRVAKRSGKWGGRGRRRYIARNGRIG